MKQLIHTLLISLFSIPAFSQVCVDTLIYPQAKATDFLGVTMNVPSEFAGYAQYYDAPEPLEILGIEFFAGINSTNNLDSATITCIVFEAMTDSIPGNILAQKDIRVGNTYFPSDINLMRQCVEFDSPVNVTTDYLVGIMTNTTQPLGIMTNDYNAGDGQNEELGFWYWTGDNTWYKSGEFFVWDVDYLIHPKVRYSLSPTLSSTVFCDTDSLCLTFSNTSAFVNHRMYNESVFNGINPEDEVIYEWGDGIMTTGIDSCHRYSVTTNTSVIISHDFGWNERCSISFMEDPLSGCIMEPIPTLSQWGIIILSLFMLILSLINIKMISKKPVNSKLI